MDFNNIFDTYTDNINPSERSNVILESPDLPSNTLSSLDKFISNYNSNDFDNFSENFENSTDTSVNDSDISEAEQSIPEDILDALSELDQDTIEPENSTIQKLTDDEETIFSDTPLQDPQENFEENFDIDTPDFSFDEIEPEDTQPNPSNNENSADIPQNITKNDTDDELSDFLTSLSDDSNDNQDFFEEDFVEPNEEIWNEESVPSISDDQSADEFDIELPEEADEIQENTFELPEDIDNDLEKDELETPDFSESTPIPDNQNISTEFEPVENEKIDKSLNFDTWKNQHSDNHNVSALELSQEQIFKVRNKINLINDKNLRFQVREIVADPESNLEYYDQLISLLLIEAPESSLQDLLKNLEDSQDTEEYDYINYSNVRSSFLAHDVALYLDNMYRIKNDFLQYIKRYALYGLIIMLSGIIAWLGVAQPLQINSIYQQGLSELRKNNFVESESLFQKASTIAGKSSADWYMKYADVYKEKELIQEASKRYSTALTIEPFNITIAKHAGDFYTNLGIQYYSNAINIMNTNSKYHPKNFEPWDYWGSLYINYSEFYTNDKPKQTELLYKAAGIYQEFIIKNPNNPAPFYKMIEIYIKIGNRAQVDKIFQLIDKLYPKYMNLDIMNQLAKFYIDHRELNNAALLFKKLTPVLDQYSQNVPKLQEVMSQYYNIHPDSISNILSTSYYEYARYSLLSSDTKKTGTLLTNSILFNSNNSDSYNLLGENYLRSSSVNTDTLAKADELFNKSLAIDPNNYKAHVNLGHMYYFWDSSFGDIKNAHSTALFHYNIAKSLIPDNIKNCLLSYNYGWLLYQNQNYTDAVNSWSDVYKANPNNPSLSYALGSALFKINKPQLAQIEFSKTIDSFENLKKNIPVPDLQNKRHREIFTQLSKAYNNLGVINANFSKANPSRSDYFDSQALLHFYNAQNLADQLNSIYSTAEYNIGVMTRPNIRNRETIFDDNLPKQTSIENFNSSFNRLLLSNI